MELKIHCQGFWPGAGQIWPFKKIFPNVSFTTYDNCDISMCGDFGRIEAMKLYRDDVLHIHYSLENLDSKKYKRWRSDYKIPKKHLISGLVKPGDTSIFFPNYMNELRMDDIKNFENSRNDGDFEYRLLGGIVAVRKARYKHRENLINFYKADNQNPRPNRNLSRNRSKEDLIKNYLISIESENSRDADRRYITEKITNGINAGCIPIYWGGNLDYTPYNQNRIINIEDAFNPPPLDLENDKFKLRDMYYMPIFNNNAQEMIDELWSNTEKKILDLL